MKKISTIKLFTNYLDENPTDFQIAGNRLNIKGNTFSNFFAYITEETFSNITNQKSYHLTLCNLTSKSEESKIISQEDFANLKWFNTLSRGFDLLSPAKKDKLAFNALINEFSDSLGVARTNIYNQIGWQKNISDDKSYYSYLYHNGEITDHNIGICCKTDASLNNLEKYSLLSPRNNTDIEKAARTSRKLLNLMPENIIYPLIGLTYLSPIYTFLEGQDINPSFTTWLKGKQQFGKTTISSAVMKHFGPDFSIKNPPSTFADTENSMIERFSCCGDTIFWVDDYHPTPDPNQAKAMNGKANVLLRSGGNRSGKNRLDSTITSVNTNDIKGFALVTGEDFPKVPQSGATRCFFLEMDSKLSPEAFKFAHENCNNLSYAMHGYIQSFLTYDPFYELDERYSYIIEKFKSYFEDLDRTTYHAIALQLGFESAVNFWLSLDIISKEEAEELNNKSFDILIQHIQKFDEQNREYNLIEEFKSKMQSIISTGNQGTIKPIGTRGSGNTIAWEDDTHYYFPPTKLQEVLSKGINPITTTPRTLYKELESNQIITLRGTSETALLKAVYKNNRIKVIAINKSSIFPPEENIA